MSRPAIQVAPIHFSDFSGEQFERLVFAYHVRTEPRFAFEWYGQTGADGGRDVVGRGIDIDNVGETIVIACANWDPLTSTKAIKDFDKTISTSVGKPNEFRVVTRAAVSSAVRDKIRDHCVAKGVGNIKIWGGAEFEEHLRHRAQSLIFRFVEGRPFPDKLDELIAFSRTQPPGADAEIVSQFGTLFDRPAFRDRIWKESSLPAFKQALEDTIRAINTGIWATREGTEIARICSVHLIQNEQIKKGARAVVEGLANLRTEFDEGLRSGSIKPCNCQQPNCPIFHMDDEIADRLAISRQAVLDDYHKVEEEAKLAV